MIHLLFSRISVFILKGPELRDSQEKNNEKAKGQQCMSKVKNIELFGPEGKKSNFVNHLKVYSKKEERQRE